jgi:hypothetical protein
VVTDVVRAESPGPFTPLRLGAVAGLRPGHEVDGHGSPVGSAP